MKKAFTLIELLVVVLIIGILAAVALPQYQKAVMRARVAEYRINLDALAKAANSYYLANSTYANGNDLAKLDIVLPECKLLPGLDSFVNNCQYTLYGFSGHYSNTPVVQLRNSSRSLGDMLILPIKDQPAGLKAGTLYCRQLEKGPNCTHLGCTSSIQKGTTTYYF